MKKFFKKRNIIILAGIFLFLLIIYLIFPKGSEGLTIELKKEKFESIVEATGEIFASKSVSACAPPSRVRLQVIWLIKEGEQVKEGDVLVKFDPGELLKELNERESELKSLNAELRQREENLKAMELDYEMQMNSARLDYELAKVQVVEDEGLVPKKNLEEAKLRLKAAEERYNKTKEKLESAKREAQANIEIVKVRIKNAKNNYDFAKDSLDKMTVKAPSSGLVVLNEIWTGGEERKVQVGDSVWPGFCLISLPDFSTLRAKVWVSEIDAGKIQKGQKAFVSVDAFPGLKIDSEVESISQVGSKRNWDSTKKEFEVVLALSKIDERLRPGMTSHGEIVVEEIKDVLKVPVESVKEEEGKNFVFLKTRFGSKKVEVKLGKRNSTHIIVESGLKEGDKVFLIPPEESKK
ncbi:MAG: efflux RND transporter periplasmic adaptor subunit [Thermoanaerobaculia bacterium]